MSTMRGARSALVVALARRGRQRSRLAYMFLRARGWRFEWCCWFECPRCGAATACMVLLVSVAVLTRHAARDLQR